MDSKLLFQTMSEKENALEKEVLEIINSVNDEAYIDLKTRLKEVDAETKLKIAFIGQHNAGKSTIVSALTNDSSIRISARVETDETAEYKWGDVYLYDTPGLRAGVKDKHDYEAMEAIKSSDLLVYCLTASLFDDVMIKDFVNLAYEKGYKCKMILVVNKMALEAGEFDELVSNYKYSINEALEQYGGKISDFPVAFIDAMDYKNAVADEDEELIEFSNFRSFVDILNRQTEEKDLTAKVLTKCTILLDAISSVVSSTGTQTDKNMVTILNRLRKSVRKCKRDARKDIGFQKIDLRARIMDIGDEITLKLGDDFISESDIEKVNLDIEETVGVAIEEMEKHLEEMNTDLIEEMGDILTSDIGTYVFQNVVNEKYTQDSEIAAGYKSMFAAIGKAAHKLGMDSSKFSKIADSDGDLPMVVSGKTLCDAVGAIGKFFGSDAVKTMKVAKKAGKVAQAIGPALEMVGVVMDVAEKIEEERRIVAIQKAQVKSYNSFSSIASDIINEIEMQYEAMERETFDVYEADIVKMQTDLINVAQNNSEQIGKLKAASKEIRAIMDLGIVL